MFRITSRVYENLSNEWISIHSRDQTEFMKNEFWTDERRDYYKKFVMTDEKKIKHSEFMKEYWTDERRIAKSKQRIKYFENNPEAKEYLRQQQVLHQPKECEYCGIVCSTINYNRWHGNRCSTNPDVLPEELEARKQLGRSNKGKKHSIETIEKRNVTRRLRGIRSQPHSQETKQLLSEIALNRPKVKCIYCGLVCSKSNYIRWHRR